MSTQIGLSRSATSCVALLVAALAVACSTVGKDLHVKGASPPYRFMHQQHRVAYAMTEDDLKQLQFFVSDKVVAHDLGATGAASVVLVPAGTPGLAVSAGPDWIRVRFQQGGQGVVFLANPNARSDSQYTLATEDDGGYRLVKDTPDRVLRVGDRRFEIVEGADAHLLVDADTLKKLIEGRRKIEGARLPEK